MTELAECTYCGKPAEGRDHVPPKCLFRPPLPSTLITVPSCAACNQGASKDDEYFRYAVSLRHDVGHTAEAQLSVDAICRSLARREQLAFANHVRHTLHDVEVKTPAGIYLGNAGIYQVTPSRLNRVAARITAGLYYHHFNERLPAGFEAVATALDFQPKDWLHPTIAKVLNAAPTTSMGNVFSYRYAKPEPASVYSVWLLLFYGAAPFIGLTGRQR